MSTFTVITAHHGTHELVARDHAQAVHMAVSQYLDVTEVRGQ